MQRPNQLGQLAHHGEPFGHQPASDHRQLLVPESKLVLACFLVPDRAQQGIALRKDARKVRQVASSAAVALTHDRVQEAASLRR